MRPLHASRADREFVIGETYLLGEVDERSDEAHKKQFAWLRDAWMSLPEDLMDLYPSPEHLRKRALIDCGFFTDSAVRCLSCAEAVRVAAQAQASDEFALVFVMGRTVTVRRARSQKKLRGGGDMDRAEFNRAMQAVMELVASMLGVGVDEVKRARSA
jgi:hypothetical protein